jgi:hypothetical protein
MLDKQEDNELSVLIDNTPHDVLVSINKIVFEQLLNDKFVAYFKDFKDDMSSLYAFYISISKDLQVDKNFKTFMRFFINYIDKNDIQVTFQHGAVGYVHGPCVLSVKTLDHFVFALKKRYSKSKLSKEAKYMYQLWTWKHVVLTITKGPNSTTVCVFRDRIVKETEEMMHMEYSRTIKSITRLDEIIPGLKQKLLEDTNYLKKYMSSFLTRSTTYDWECDVMDFMHCVLGIYKYLRRLRDPEWFEDWNDPY